MEKVFFIRGLQFFLKSSDLNVTQVPCDGDGSCGIKSVTIAVKNRQAILGSLLHVPAPVEENNNTHQ